MTLFSYDMSDLDSISTADRLAEAEGEEMIELMDAVTGDPVDIDSVRISASPAVLC